MLAMVHIVPAAAAESPAQADAKTRDALVRAIEDGRAAKSFYSAVIERHGKIRPFVGILEAERRQEATLAALCKTYGVSLSAPTGSVPAVPASVEEACGMAAQAERENVALYDEVLPTVTDRVVRDTLQSLRTASAERHLPAFERCVERGAALPAVLDTPDRCESCGMVGCGCSASAKAADTAAPQAGAAKPHGCGCMRRNQ
jgi:hypothetical protein